MIIKLERFLPYANVTKNWLTNLSVASFAVGLYDQNYWGLLSGSVLLICAWWIVFLEKGADR